MNSHKNAKLIRHERKAKKYVSDAKSSNCGQAGLMPRIGEFHMPRHCAFRR
jgi:hypothetical protein